MARRPPSIRDPELAAVLRAALEQGAFAPADASRVIRALEGLSQADLAERAGLNVKVIKAIESGRGVPRYDSLTKLAAVADLRIALVGGAPSVGLMDARKRMADECNQRLADARALASGVVSERKLNERNALRVDELRYELPRLA